MAIESKQLIELRKAETRKFSPANARFRHQSGELPKAPDIAAKVREFNRQPIYERSIQELAIAGDLASATSV